MSTKHTLFITLAFFLGLSTHAANTGEVEAKKTHSRRYDIVMTREIGIRIPTQNISGSLSLMPNYPLAAKKMNKKGLQRFKHTSLLISPNILLLYVWAKSHSSENWNAHGNSELPTSWCFPELLPATLFTENNRDGDVVTFSVFNPDTQKKVNIWLQLNQQGSRYDKRPFEIVLQKALESITEE
jgi:hypothetical protein